MKAKSKLLTLTLLGLTSIGPLHSASNINGEATSWNPRDYTSSDMIPVSLMSGIVSRLSQMNIGVITKEMEKNGETERVVMSKVSFEGGLVHMDNRTSFAASFETFKDLRFMWVPFKISLEEDGSYSRSVGVFSAQNNSDFNMDSFSGWVKVRDLKAVNFTKEKDEFTGNEVDKFNVLDMKVDIGILDFEGSALYLKTGFTFGSYENSYMTQLGEKLKMDTKSAEYNVGLHYRAGSMSDWYMDVGVGYQSETGEGHNFLRRDHEIFNGEMDLYNTAYDAFEDDLANYEQEKAQFEAEHNFAPGTVSEESFANHPDGRAKPVFTMHEPSLQSTRMKLNRKSVYGSMKVLKYLRDQNIQIGFSLEAKSFQDNEASGVNSLQEDILLQLRDKNRVDASFEVRF